MTNEDPKCTQLIIVGTFSDGKSSTLVIPEPEKVSMEWVEAPPDKEDVLVPTKTTLYVSRWEFRLSAKSGQRGALETRSPVE
jgi:hypothetical protein